MDCFIASDRVNTAPWGLNGGKAALGARFTVNRADGTEEHCLRKQGCVFIRKIDSIFRQVAAEVGVIRLREIKKH